MKRYLLLLFLVPLYISNICQAYKIVTLPSSERNNQDEISLKVFFSTKTVSEKRTVTTTITQSVFPTCYATEPGIVPCQRKRDFGDSNEEEPTDESHEPKVFLNGVQTAWDTFITPSRVSIFKGKHIIDPDFLLYPKIIIFLRILKAMNIKSKVL